MAEKPGVFWIPRFVNSPRVLGSLTGAECKVLLSLSEFADSTGVGFPGNPILASRCGLTIQGVEKALKGLRKKGWVRVLEVRGGRGRANVLQVTWGAVKGWE